MRERKIDNFKKWRAWAKEVGRLKDSYSVFKRNGDLAELLGCVLGDGHICQHARCDSLRITGNADNLGFTKRYTDIMRNVFGKEPAVAKAKNSNAITITVYERFISKRLGIPHGARKNLHYVLPAWIRKSKTYRIRFLRGLYEAEGSICYHAKTSTHKVFFSNRNQHLLELVSGLVQELGFRVNISNHNLQVSRKAEVQNLINLLEFRHYKP